MATERQSPDVLLDQTNLTGTVSAIQDDPDSPDGNWLTYISNNVDTVCRVSFPTPTGNPTVGADLQEFKIWVRQQPDGARADPTVRIELYENGVSKGTLLADTAVSSPTGALYSGFWNANLLGTADGSLVECYIYGTAVGGAPSNRCTVEVGAVEWNVTYSAGVTEWLAGVINGVASASGAVVASRKIAGATAGIALVSGSTSINKKIAGLVAGISSITGIASISKTLTGAISGVCSVTAIIQRFRPLAGIISGIASVAGDLTVTGGEVIEWLAGVVAGNTTVNGSIVALRKLSGDIAGIASPTGSISITKVLAGISAGASAIAGNISVGVTEYLAGAVAGITQVSGTISVTGIRYLVGIASGATSLVVRLRKKLVAPTGREVKSYEPTTLGEIWY